MALYGKIYGTFFIRLGICYHTIKEMIAIASKKKINGISVVKLRKMTGLITVTSKRSVVLALGAVIAVVIPMHKLFVLLNVAHY